MELIPVIDLRHGQAVMARRGQRHSYRPSRTPLCPSSDPLRVAEAYLRLYPFRTLYIADLDAILKTGDNTEAIQRIQRHLPALTLWIDRSWPPVSTASGQIPVIGSESLGTEWHELLCSLSSPWILSLDFDQQGFLGPGKLLDHAEIWPEQVILMTLARVGGNAGPDWERLDEFRHRHPEISWIAAGGIRHRWDLSRLEAMNIRRALVARALHEGRLRCLT